MGRGRVLILDIPRPPRVYVLPDCAEACWEAMEAAPAHPDRPAIYAAIAVFLLLVVLDVWLRLRDHRSISRWLQGVFRRRWWMRWLLGLPILVMIGWHLLWGYPW